MSEQWKTLNDIPPGQFTITTNQPKKQNQYLCIQVLQTAKDIRFTGVPGTYGRWWLTWHLHMCNDHRTSGWSYWIWMSYPWPSRLSPYCSHLPSFLSLLSCCRHHESPHLIVHSLKLGLNSQSSSESHCFHWNTRQWVMGKAPIFQVCLKQEERIGEKWKSASNELTTSNVL